jgi:hypothetical protein
MSPPYSRTIFPVFPTEAKRSSQNGAGDLVQHSRTMRIPLKLSFRGLCGEYSVKPGVKSKVAIVLWGLTTPNEDFLTGVFWNFNLSILLKN